MNYRIRVSARQLAQILSALEPDATLDMVMRKEQIQDVVENLTPEVDADGLELGQLLRTVLEEQPGEQVVHSMVL